MGDSLAGFETGNSAPEKFGRFQLEELINSGGMAEIWVATDGAGKTFALKRLHHRLKFNLISRRRFFRGCDILARIHKHDYVIGYVEHGRIAGLPYLLMEYVEASNLKLLYARSDSSLTENAAQILIDSAIALEHVHDSGLMHLDFKPENILVTRNGNVRLIDFDLALPRPDKAKPLAKNPGTPAYMAPEQLQRGPVDHRADIFAFGVTAYELLTFQKPFAGETAENLLQTQLTIRPRALTEINPDLPLELNRIVSKCLEPEVEQRYPFMSVVVRDLEAALYVP